MQRGWELMNINENLSITESISFPFLELHGYLLFRYAALAKREAVQAAQTSKRKKQAAKC